MYSTYHRWKGGHCHSCLLRWKWCSVPTLPPPHQLSNAEVSRHLLLVGKRLYELIEVLLWMSHLYSHMRNISKISQNSVYMKGLRQLVDRYCWGHHDQHQQNEVEIPHRPRLPSCGSPPGLRRLLWEVDKHQCLVAVVDLQRQLAELF